MDLNYPSCNGQYTLPFRFTNNMKFMENTLMKYAYTVIYMNNLDHGNVW